MAAKEKGEGEWPHHQILRVHRQYAFRQHLRIQEAVPYLQKRRAVPKSLAEEISKFPSQENDDYNINFLLGYLREARVERFVRFIEGLGDSISPALDEEGKSGGKSHAVLIDIMSEDLEKISNADMDQVRRVRAVVKMVRADQTETPNVEEGVGQSDIITNVSETEGKSSTVIETAQPTNDTESADDKQVASAIETQAIPKRETEVEPAKSSLRPIGCIKPGITKFFQRNSLAKDQTSWFLYNPTHGISIDIPVRAVPSEILEFVVIAHAYLYGNYKIPEEYEVCTAIVTLRTKPDFDFLEPVSLTLPHSAVFDGDEDDEDLVVLRAPDPTPNTDEYDFRNDIIHSTVSFDDYHVHVSLDHFSAVAGAKRKQKCQPARHGVPVKRQVSSSKQRSIKCSRRKKLRRFRSKGSGDSIGSSRGSSYDTSFERDAPCPRQGSSADSEAPVQRSLLHRQGAIDDNTPGTSAHMIHQTSSQAYDASCNEICVAYCYPIQRLTSWTNRFLVAPNHPTGIKALNDSKMLFEKKKVRRKTEWVVRSAIPCSRILCFGPEGKNSHWIVEATSTPQISLDIVQYTMQDEHCDTQFVDFEAESTNQQSSTPLKHRITVTGVEDNLFFTVQSTTKSVKQSHQIICVKSWLFTEDSQILKKLAQQSEEKSISQDHQKKRISSDLEGSEGLQEKSIPLAPEHMSTSIAEEHLFKADVCKLMAEIAFQTTDQDEFLEQLPISDYQRRRLSSDYDDPTECIYRALFVWIHEKRPHLLELKEFLQRVGFEDIVLSCSEAPMQNSNCLVVNNRPCERQLCVHLASKLQHHHWKFVGRYLGLDGADIDGVQYEFERDGRTEVIFKMLEKWRQQFGEEAKMISLLKAVFRVNMLDPCCIQDAVSYLRKELSSTEISQ